MHKTRLVYSINRRGFYHYFYEILVITILTGIKYKNMFFSCSCLFCDVGKDTLLKKLAEFKTSDEKLAIQSQQQLSHLCAQLDQGLIHAWQQLKAVERQQ